MLDVVGLLNALRQSPPKLFGGLAVACGLVLFSSEGFLKALGLATIRDDYRVIIGLTFITSVSICAIESLVLLYKFVMKKLKEQRDGQRKVEAKIKRQQILHKLTPDEKAYLAPYVIGEKNTLYFQIEDGIAGGLVMKKILYISSSVGSIIDGSAHNMQSWAKEYLNDNPHLLDGATERPRERSWL